MKQRVVYGLILLLLLGVGCKRDKITPNESRYPEDVHRILRETCATTGCHTAQSAPAAAGLNLETWEALFQGSRGGSPVVPYSPDLSYLMYSVTDDSTLGPVLPPTMPLNQPALSTQDYYILWHWINDGCPNVDGELRFPPDPNREKYYVGHSECDDVVILDAESRQVMRIIEVGNQPGLVEYVFDIQISPNGQDWYVVFFGINQHIERYSTLSDEKVADIQLGEYGWSNIAFSPDGKFAFISNDYTWKMAVVDLQQNSLVAAPVSFNYETRGPVVHPSRAEVYLAENLRNDLVVVDYDNAGQLGNQRKIDLLQGTAPAVAGDLWPWEVLFLPDGSKYFVSCSHSNELRVFDAQTDSLLDVIVLPAGPSKMGLSQATGRLFVSCMIDNVSWGGDPTKLGSVVVVNATSHLVEQTIYPGFQPYGLAVDDANGVVVVANRNTDPSGPRPHHSSPCGDRNGYLSMIDLHSLELIPNFKPELLVDPIIVSKK